MDGSFGSPAGGGAAGAEEDDLLYDVIVHREWNNRNGVRQTEAENMPFQEHNLWAR